MTLYSAHLGDVVRLDGRDHELVGIRGREVQLRNMDTGAVVWMLQHDLWAEAERPALLPTTLGSVQHITESDDQARMAGHWLEVIDGTRPDEPDAPPRSTYDPATTTLTQRIQAKWLFHFERGVALT